jgi:hypothetical protein
MLRIPDILRRIRIFVSVNHITDLIFLSVAFEIPKKHFFAYSYFGYNLQQSSKITSQ